MTHLAAMMLQRFYCNTRILQKKKDTNTHKCLGLIREARVCLNMVNNRQTRSSWFGKAQRYVCDMCVTYVPRYV